MQALNIYIALLERRRLLASVQRQNSLGSQQDQSPQASSTAADADLDKVIAAIVPHVPTLAAVLCASSPSALLVSSPDAFHMQGDGTISFQQRDNMPQMIPHSACYHEEGFLWQACAKRLRFSA